MVVAFSGGESYFDLLSWYGRHFFFVVLLRFVERLRSWGGGGCRIDGC